MYRPPPISGASHHDEPRNSHFQRQKNFTNKQFGQHQWRSPRPVHHDNFKAEHWCETCDRGFQSVHMLQSHKQQHQKCNIDGCQFIAHPKVITKHIQMQHSSGLFKKIANLKNPEDIAKWREERKKKYPTKENVEKKIAEIKEKVERGEKMGLHHKNKNKNFDPTGETQKRKYPFGNKKRYENKKSIKTSHQRHEKKKTTPKPEVIPHEEKRWSLKPFAGIQSLMDDTVDEIVPTSDFLIDDDDDSNYHKESVASANFKDKATVCGALSALMCEYGSSDEDDKDMLPVSTKTAMVVTSETTEIVKSIQKKLSSDDDSGPDEIKNEKFSEIPLETPKNNPTKSTDVNLKKDIVTNKKYIKPKPTYNKLRKKLPSTLLQKLLHKEIKQERNIVLQCVHHIVKNNFFDVNL